MGIALIGALFDRFGARVVYVSGLVAYGAGFQITAHMEALWQGWLGLGLLVGIGAAATGMTPATGLISRWFDRNMAFAISFAYSGFAAGSFLLAPLSGVMIQYGGWRWTYATLGWALLALAVAVIVLPWSRIEEGRRPKSPPRSLIPDGRIFRQVPFWGLFAVFFLTSTSTYVVQVPAVVYLVEAGYAPLTATFIFGINALISVAGIVGAGWLADRYGQRWVATIAYSSTIVGIGALAMMSTGPDPVLLGLFMLGFGGAMGSRGPVVSSLTARLFEGQVGAVFGLVTFGLGLGGAFGAWASGWLHEQTGDYLAGFGLAGVSCLLGIAVFWLIPEFERGVVRGPRR